MGKAYVIVRIALGVIYTHWLVSFKMVPLAIMSAMLPLGGLALVCIVMS